MFHREIGERTAAAKVTNNEDPEKRGRIKITCVALLGDESRELPGWIETALPWGWFAIPDVGQQVTISYSLGSSNDTFAGQSSIASSNVRWHGATHFTDENAPDPNVIGEEFTSKNYGKRRGFKTPNGHVLMFDDSPGDQQIRMSWAGGTPVTPKTAYWAIDKSGSFVCQDAAGNLLFMNGANDGEMSMIHNGGNRFVINKDGISMVDTHGNAIIMDENGVSIVSSKPIALTGSDTIVKNGLHFVNALGLGTNVGGMVALMNPGTIEGVALLTTVTAAGAVPPAADGTALLTGVGAVAAL